MIICLGILTGIMVVSDLLLIMLWIFHFKNFHPVAHTDPHVSTAHPEFLPLASPILSSCPPVAVLVAVRNEEHQLGACLDHLLAQDYPPEKMRIWVGNDASADNTLNLARQYAAKDQRIRVIDVKENLGQAQAKANVVSHLAQANAQDEHPADFLLVTDADVRAPRHWIKGMLQCWEADLSTQQPGIITGVTLVENNNLWAQLQHIDWLFALGMVKITSDLGVPTATLGNNMMMTRQAYEATGGYESLPFSITEDFQILREITKKGFGFRNAIHQHTAVFTLPMTDFSSLLQQRKRWMHGAVQLPYPIVIILFLQTLFYPLLIGLAIFHLRLSLLIFAGKLLMQSAFILLVVEKLQLKRSQKIRVYLHLLPYEIYAAVTGLLTIFYYYLPFSTVWKDRSFF